jgi:hypothetical protein
MNSYEAKQETRRARLLAAAARAEAAATAAFNRAQAATASIPFGQPILVDHYSAPRHRAALKRQASAMRRASELTKLAKTLRAQAEVVGSAGISSDDPDAVEKLIDKRTALERQRDEMKAANVFYRQHKTLEGAPVSAELIEKALRNLGYHSCPFPSYALQNIGARIRTAAKRVGVIERAATVEDAEEIVNGATVITDTTENRVLLRFPARLANDQYKLVRRAGFLWSPTRNAFVRKLTPVAVDVARTVARSIPAAN